MTAISAFVVTILTNKKMEDGRKVVTATLAAGNGSLTYPTGGLALSAAALGFQSGQIDSVAFSDQAADGYVYTWKKSTGKILSFVESGTAAHILQETATSVTPTIALTIMAIGY